MITREEDPVAFAAALEASSTRLINTHHNAIDAAARNARHRGHTLTRLAIVVLDLDDESGVAFAALLAANTPAIELVSAHPSPRVCLVATSIANVVKAISAKPNGSESAEIVAAIELPPECVLVSVATSGGMSIAGLRVTNAGALS